MLDALPDIGLIGRARTGKDTAAHFLIDAHGYQRMAFADPVREGMAELDPIVNTGYTGGVRAQLRYRRAVELYGYEAAKDIFPEFRRLLQHYGTGLRGALGPDVWVKAMVRRIEAAEADPIVITDVRFANEAEALRKLGFVLIRLTRADAPGAGDHVSETEQDTIDVDHTVSNDGTIAELRAALDEIITVDPALV